MTITVQSLDDIPQATIDAAFDFAAQILGEKHPNLENRRGVVGQLVTGLDAILSGASSENVELLRQSMSLLEITENPTLADEDVVDAVISNYMLSRRAAQQATGEITIELSQLTAVTIAAGAIFTADGQQFTSDAAYNARTAAENVIEDTDRLITQVAADRWVFTINATAVEAGSAGLLKKDTAMVPLTAPPSFVKAYASTDFADGVDAQTNQELIDSLAGGIAARAWSNRDNIPSMIRNADPDVYDMVTAAFPDIVAMSIVGHNDPEMVRDQHWLFPVSGGGRCDLYVRSQAQDQSLTLTKTATLIDKTADGGIWQFSIGRDEAPGFYEVEKILVEGAPADSSGYGVTEDIRALDLTGDDYIPDLMTVLEGIYSRYQASTIRFLDEDTATTALTVNSDTQSYTVTVSTMPLVKEVQQYVGERNIIWPAGDVVVKAAVPCFLSLNIQVQRLRTDVDVDTASIQSALASYVNKTGFITKLYAAELSCIVEGLLPANTSVGLTDMHGRIRRPDGTMRYIRDDTVLTVVDEPAFFTTGRTVVFILNTADISIEVTNADIPDI
jgi:hypothetical protein